MSYDSDIIQDMTLEKMRGEVSSNISIQLLMLMSVEILSSIDKITVMKCLDSKQVSCGLLRPRGYKLNSVEHEILNAHK